MAWQLRVAGAADLEAIMAIETPTFADDAWSPPVMLAELSSEHCHYLVAFRPETPERIEGYAGLLAPEGGTEADIQTIAVVADSRGAGLGRLLMRTLIGEARRRGAGEVFLEVRADNPAAEGLYRSLGFEAIAVRPAYYQPEGIDAVVMRLVVPEPRLSPAEED